jgi:serine O-acetyltransferase
MFSTIKSDWRRLSQKRVYDSLVHVLSNNGFRAVMIYRISNYLQSQRIPIIPQLVSSVGLALTGCEIQPKALIGPGLEIKHPCGIVIGAGAVIGRNLTILQNVTIGESLKPGDKNAYPIIGDDVTICAGAVVVGSVLIGKGSMIGANAVVLQNVPDFGVAVGVPARVVNSVRPRNM